MMASMRTRGYVHSYPAYHVHLTELAATRGTAPKHDSTSSPTVPCFAYLTTTKALAVPGYALRKLFHRQLPIKRPAAEKNVAWWRNALLVKHVRYTSGVGPGQAHMSGHPAHHSSGSWVRCNIGDIRYRLCWEVNVPKCRSEEFRKWETSPWFAFRDFSGCPGVAVNGRYCGSADRQ